MKHYDQETLRFSISKAIKDPVEGAEDSEELGASDIDLHDITVLDVVVGIAASGRTPYVLGAMQIKLKPQKQRNPEGMMNSSSRSSAFFSWLPLARWFRCMGVR